MILLGKKHAMVLFGQGTLSVAAIGLKKYRAGVPYFIRLQGISPAQKVGKSLKKATGVKYSKEAIQLVFTNPKGIDVMIRALTEMKSHMAKAKKNKK